MNTPIESTHKRKMPCRFDKGLTISGRKNSYIENALNNLF